MKEKVIKKETVEIVTPQEILCQNIAALSAAFSSLGEIDTSILGKEMQAKVEETQDNILNSLHYMSSWLKDKPE